MDQDLERLAETFKPGYVRILSKMWDVGKLVALLAPTTAIGCVAIQDAVKAANRPPIPESAYVEQADHIQMHTVAPSKKDIKKPELLGPGNKYEKASKAIDLLTKEKDLERKLSRADYLIENANLFSINALTDPLKSGVKPEDHADINALRLQNQLYANLVQAEKDQDFDSQIMLRKVVDRIDPERDHFTTMNIRNYTAWDYFKEMEIMLSIFGASEEGHTVGVMLPLELIVQGIASLVGQELEDGIITLKPEIPTRVVREYIGKLYVHTQSPLTYKLNKDKLAETIEKLPLLPDKWTDVYAREMIKIIDLFNLDGDFYPNEKGLDKETELSHKMGNLPIYDFQEFFQICIPGTDIYKTQASTVSWDDNNHIKFYHDNPNNNAVPYDSDSIDVLLSELTKRDNKGAFGTNSRSAVAGLLKKIVITNHRFLMPEHQDALAELALENEDARDVLGSIDHFYLTEKSEQTIQKLAGVFKPGGKIIKHGLFNISYEVDDKPLSLAVAKDSYLPIRKPENVFVDNNNCEFLEKYIRFMGFLRRIYHPDPDSIEDLNKNASFMQTEKNVVRKLVNAFYQAESYTEAAVGISLALEKEIDLNLSQEQIIESVYGSLSEIDASNEKVSTLETISLANLIGKYQQHDAANYLLSLIVEKGDNESLKVFRDVALFHDLKLDNNILKMYRTMYQKQEPQNTLGAIMINELMTKRVILGQK